MPKYFIWTAIITILLGFVYISSNVLMPFAIAFLLSYLLSPFVRHAEHSWKINRGALSLITVTALSLIFISFWVLIVPIIYHQISSFIYYMPKHKPVFIEDIVTMFDSYLTDEYRIKLNDMINNVFSQISKILVSFVDKIWHSGLVFINGIITIILVPLITFYFLRDWNNFHMYFEKLIPRKQKQDANILMNNINTALSGFIRGQLNVCLVLAVYYSVSLSITGLNFGALIGITTGLLAFVPFLGFLSGFTSALVVALFQYHDIKNILIVAMIFIIGNIIESIMGPKLIGNKIGVSPVWIIFCVLLGGSIFNFIGVFFAVPICAIISVIIRFMINKYHASPLYKN